MVHSHITQKRNISIRYPSFFSSYCEDFTDAASQVSTYTHEYSFKTAPSRDSEAFGVEQFGRLVLVEKSKLAVAVKAMEDA